MAGITLNYAYLTSVALGNGKMTVPVDPNQSLYATYNNVKGVPALEGTSGLSLIGLKIVDTIIENIRSARAAQNKQMDGMDAFRQMVQKFQKAQEQLGPYTPKIQNGLFINVNA